jgi:hypothetical protein
MAIGTVYTAPAIRLNEKLRIEDIPVEARKAFVGGSAVNVALERNLELYKFTSGSLVWKGKISPWWSPVLPYEMDPGLESRLGLARHLGVHPSDLTRVMAAVSEEFNQLQFILKVRLNYLVHGLWGQCAMMPRQGGAIAKGREIPADQKGAGIRVPGGIPGTRGTNIYQIRTQNLPGTAWQFYIPNLTTNYVVEISRLPAQ